MSGESSPVLTVSDLRIRYDGRGGAAHAVNGVSFSLAAGEVLGLAGERGTGKTSLLRAVAGELPVRARAMPSGGLSFRDRDFAIARQDRLGAGVGRHLQGVFPDSDPGFRPWLTVGHQLVRVLRRRMKLPRSTAVDRVAETLGRVGIADPERVMKLFPGKVPAGDRSRLLLAKALMFQPSVLLLDTPDADGVALVKGLAAEGVAVILATEDLRSLAGIADRIVVLHAGRVVEQGAAAQILGRAEHPLVREMLAGGGGEGDAVLRAEPRNCPFAARCPEVFNRCRVEVPSLRYVAEGHAVSCWWDREQAAPYRDR